MPRDGSGVYDVPPGTEGTPNTTILSAAYNAFIADLVADLNAARPVTAGGTGGTSVITGWDGLAKKGTDIADAATINLTTATGPSITMLGTTTLTGVTLAEGSFRLVRAAAAKTITASASLLVNGSASGSYTTTAEDLLIFRGGAAGVVSVAVLGAATPDATTSIKGKVQLSTPAQALTGTSTSLAVTPAGLYFPTGHLYGLTLSNNGSDATNDIDIAAGTARDGSDTVNMILSSALTKQVDAAWSVGSAAGGLDTGSVANTTYYIWLIKRSDTGVVDALFSTSSSAPTMPSSYDYKRLIGYLVRAGAANGLPIMYAQPDVQLVGSAPTFACRAWVNWDGSGTVTIRGSGNVSSVTDNGTGDYSPNFTTAMPDANYAFATGSDRAGNNTTNSGFAPMVYARATTSVSVITLSTTTNSLADYEAVSVAIFR